jgi:hypothetical protein
VFKDEEGGMLRKIGIENLHIMKPRNEFCCTVTRNDIETKKVKNKIYRTDLADRNTLERRRIWWTQ